MLDGTAYQNGWTGRVRLHNQAQTVLQNHVRGKRMRCGDLELLQGAGSPGRKLDRPFDRRRNFFEAAVLLFVSRPFIRGWMSRGRWRQGSDDHVRVIQVL